MLKGIVLFSLLLFVSGPAVADDLNVLESLEGEYHILQFNDNHSPTGILRVVVENQVGIQVEPLHYPNGQTPSSNVPTQTLLSPVGVTTVVKSGALITQTADLGDRKIKIQYENYGDFMIIQGTDCGEGCAADKLVVGRAGSFGGQINGRTFFEKVQGTYKNEKVGGLKAKESTAELNAILDADEGMGLLVAPYCDKEETFCDPGYKLLQYDRVKVWHRNLGNDHHIYDIFVTESEFMHLEEGYYRWEERPHPTHGKEVLFKNVQYVFPNTTELLCMEHVAHPA